MAESCLLPKYSIGVGDRFGQQAKAQLRACMLAAEAGVDVTPVWNKSNREHNIIGSTPADVRASAEAAVRELHWDRAYFVDADHINLSTVDKFIDHCDFYTIDVADSIGRPSDQSAVQEFLRRHPEFSRAMSVPGIAEPFDLDSSFVERVAQKYLGAVREASRIYSHISERKGDAFVAEISMDETDTAQGPAELLIVLAAVADEGIPIQTIAPKFSGRFNKGVDYVGDVGQFVDEFAKDLAVVAFAIDRYGLRKNLKLSIHSGSDKFSIYEPIRRAIRSADAGIHLKTAGTSWLEELIGLAEAGKEGLDLAKVIYREAWLNREELCMPYATVIDIDPRALPAPDVVDQWSSIAFGAAVRNDRKNGSFNPSMRQLLHVAFKVAAKMGSRYLDLVKNTEATIGNNVTHNLFERHIRPLFVD